MSFSISKLLKNNLIKKFIVNKNVILNYLKNQTNIKSYKPS